MKASVITLHSVCNYGTQLQAYATQEKLKEYFDEVSYIDFCRKDTVDKELIETFSKGNSIRKIAFLPTYHKWKRIFPNFQKQYLNIKPPRIIQGEKIDTSDYNADAFFSGSDQVWNTGWNNGVIPEFYLNFAPNNAPKFAYSSSFGKNKLDKTEIPEVKALLKRYDYISVREESGLDIINNQLGLNNAIQLNDPTLAFGGTFWRKLKSEKKSNKKYILIYSLNNNPDFDKFAKKLAKKNKCKLYRFCTRYDQAIKTGAPLLIPKVEDFITYIDNAELVLTDSFHATAFSVNLNTNFLCYLPPKYSSRLSDFLKYVQLESQIIYDFSTIPEIKKVNFTKSNKILEQGRKEYDLFLTNVMKKINHAKALNEKRK